METLSDEFASQKQLAITEKFEGFINYMYPIALNIRRTHGIARDRLIMAMFEQVSMFSQAGKSGQVSKLYLADAGLSELRYMVRFLSDGKRKQSVISAKRKIFKYRARGDALSLQRFIASWQGHAQWADSYNLLNKLGVSR